MINLGFGFQYETEEEAVKTREYLHNTRWPQSNPKTLNVDYAAQDQVSCCLVVLFETVNKQLT